MLIQKPTMEGMDMDTHTILMDTHTLTLLDIHTVDTLMESRLVIFLSNKFKKYCISIRHNFRALFFKYLPHIDVVINLIYF